ncbi:MAG: GTP-binding protein [Anaerolineae bacterium]
MDVVKIIVHGAFSSGKTSLIRALSEREVVWVNFVIDRDRPDDIHGMYFGLMKDEENDLALVFLGAPGPRRFTVSWQVAQHNMLGYVIMVDSAYPGIFREAKYIIAYFKEHSPQPFVVAANKQDKAGAWAPHDLRIALDIPPEIPVIPCVATDKESAKRVLVALLDEVLKRAGVNNLDV